MNSDISNNLYTSYNNNCSNRSKYRIKRPFGALHNNYPEFYTVSSKKFKHSSNSSDSNANIITHSTDNIKNAAVFSSFSNDVEMSPLINNYNTGNHTETQQQELKR